VTFKEVVKKFSVFMDTMKMEQYSLSKRCYVTHEQIAVTCHIPEDSSFYLFLSNNAEE